MSSKQTPESAEQILTAYLVDRGYYTRIQRLQALKLWPQTVGGNIAQATRPLGVREQTLVVGVFQAVWRQQLQILKPQILHKLNSQLPAEAKLADIYLKQLPPEKSQSQPVTQRSCQLAEKVKPEDAQHIQNLTSSIKDSRIREDLQNLLQLQSRRDQHN